MVCHTIASGLPSGWAACDHSRKNGLRAKRIRVALAAAIRYGPVPGTKCAAVSWSGVPGGIGAAKASWVRLNRKSGSGAVRWNTTVRAASSVTTPRDRSQPTGCRAQAVAPMIPENKEAPGDWTRNSRSIPRRKSPARSIWPSE
jgi:hypothetical protein